MRKELTVSSYISQDRDRSDGRRHFRHYAKPCPNNQGEEKTTFEWNVQQIENQRTKNFDGDGEILRVMVYNREAS